MIMSLTYLTTDELSERIKYDSRTIRERLKDSVLLEGTHYIRPFGGRKILFVWERIEQDMGVASASESLAIPMANGGFSHG
jgi:hypothetical protein